MAKAWGSLEKIEGHPGYSVDPKSNIIYWRGIIASKPRKKSTGETQISKAKKFIDEYRLSLTTDNVDRAKREMKGIKNPRLDTLYNECIAERLPKAAKRTATAYVTVWRIDLEPFWGDMNASDMTARNVVAFENWHLKTFPGKVFFMARKNLTMLINYMHREGYIPKKIKVTDIDKTINADKKDKHFRIYSDVERKALLDAATTPRAKLALTGYFDTGMRKMELLARKWSDVDFKKETIRVYSQKNKEWRTVPLTSGFRDLLSFHYNNTGRLSEFIFCNKKGDTHIEGQYFDKEWKATKIAAGVSGKARVHDIRHTFATKTANDNWPIPVACAILDMTPDVYISTYVHITPDDIAKHLRRSFG